jgi:hypothetical protein
MDLCTVTNYKYLKNAIVLADSYHRSNTGNIFIYYFDIPDSIINIYKKTYNYIKYIYVPKECEYAHDPKVFFYKAYSLNHCINNLSHSFWYSDATNIFTRKIENPYSYFHNNMLVLPYTHPILVNKYWTSKKCLSKLNARLSSYDSPQYWAGFQGYKVSLETKKLLSTLYENMFDPDIALPSVDVKYPDGEKSQCIEHRQDQSVLSILIDLFSLHQTYNHTKQLLFGDSQTFHMFDKSSYNNYYLEPYLLSRYTKYHSL